MKEANGNVWIQILCKDASRNLVTGNFRIPTDRRQTWQCARMRRGIVAWRVLDFRPLHLSCRQNHTLASQHAFTWPLCFLDLPSYKRVFQRSSLAGSPSITKKTRYIKGNRFLCYSAMGFSQQCCSYTDSLSQNEPSKASERSLIFWDSFLRAGVIAWITPQVPIWTDFYKVIFFDSCPFDDYTVLGEKVALYPSLFGIKCMEWAGRNIFFIWPER